VFTQYDSVPEEMLVPVLLEIKARALFTDEDLSSEQTIFKNLVLRPTVIEKGVQGVRYITYEGDEYE
jgi:hypothetical protein